MKKGKIQYVCSNHHGLKKMGSDHKRYHPVNDMFDIPSLNIKLATVDAGLNFVYRLSFYMRH